jgi:hypothetical protein
MIAANVGLLQNFRTPHEVNLVISNKNKIVTIQHMTHHRTYMLQCDITIIMIYLLVKMT